MKSTLGMIEVMEAFVRGEQIQISDIGKESWEDIDGPSWDWLNNDYRIKPGQSRSKFKARDIIVFPDMADDMEVAGHIFSVTRISYEKREYGLRSFRGENVFISFGVADQQAVLADDVLWYWEYQDGDGHWEKSDYRASRAEIEKLSNFHNFIPLYALGFKAKEGSNEQV